MWRLIIFLASVSVCTGQTLRVMSYNIRYNTASDGVNAWPNRTGKVIALIQKFRPDVLGVQEALSGQVEDLTRGLPGYNFVGVGRDDGQQKGEFSAILFNKNRFSVLDWGTVWLSETPEIAGSKSWDAAITRIATWALLADGKRHDSVFVVNTHFDHVGKVAREKSATLVKEKVQSMSKQHRVVLMGDFNLEPSEKPYALITDGNGLKFSDAGPGSTQGTYCTFKVNSEPCKRIDYIFYAGRWKVKKYRVLTENAGGFYPSDHLPVTAVFKFIR